MPGSGPWSWCARTPKGKPARSQARPASGRCWGWTRPSCSATRCSASRRARATRSTCSPASPEQTHVVVSGLCLLAPGWEVVDHAETRVTFRDLTPRDVARYVATDEWHNRAGAYAIQARGAALVERIEGDYLNVVGLPAALLVGLLADRFPGAYNVA